MKIKDKNVKKILREIEELLSRAYTSYRKDVSDRYVIDVRSKVKTLLTLIDWEE